MTRRYGAIELMTPAPTYSAADRLEYPRLQPAVEEFYKDEYNQLEYLERRTDKDGERLDASSLSHRQLALIAFKLQQTDNVDERRFWGRSFTDVSVKLFGQPDQNEALGLGGEDAEVLQELDATKRVIGNTAVTATLRLYERLQGLSEGVPSVNYDGDRQVHEATRRYLRSRFGDVYEIMDSHNDAEVLSPQGTRQYFQDMLSGLQDNDRRWSNWKIVPRDTAQMAVLPSAEEIRIGTSMSSLTVKHANGLFAHEVIWHGGRSVNGRAYGKKTSTGLPGYRKIEEGGGVFIEGAVEDEMPPRIRDRYIDIALAQGLSSIEPMSRPELFDIAYGRMLLRRAGDNLPQEDDLVRRACWQHANRIFLGTPGDRPDNGVFTRNVFYYHGYRDFAYHLKQYPLTQLPNVLDFDMAAKIDVTSATQRRHLHDLQLQHKANEQ